MFKILPNLCCREPKENTVGNFQYIQIFLRQKHDICYVCHIFQNIGFYVYILHLVCKVKKINVRVIVSFLLFLPK